MKKLCIVTILFLSHICFADNQSSIDGIVSIDSASNTNEYERMLEYERSLQGLYDKLENIEKTVSDQKVKIDALEQEIEAIRGDATAGSGSMHKEEDVYSKALEAFREGRFNCAEQLLQVLANEDGSPNFNAKVMFLWGELLFKQGLYENALKKYIDSYKVLPEGQKSSDSIIRMAICLRKLGRNSQACSMLKKFEDHKGYKTQSSLLKHKDLYKEFSCENE